MFIQRVKHYHQWLRTAIPFKTKSGQIPSNSVRAQGPSKDQALATCIQPLLSKNAIERVENVKSPKIGFYSRLFLVPKPHQRWRPVIDLSRLYTFLHVEKFKMETPESIRISLIPGEWVTSIDPSDAYLHIPIHPNSRKYLRFCHRSQVFQFTSLTDNSTVVAYINKQGGTHSAEMCALLWKIMTWFHHYHITLKARHIRGCLNVMADLLSRSNQVQSTEWSLHLQVFKQICQKWFTSHLLCLPSDSSPSQGDPKNQALLLPDHHSSPRLARDALLLGPSAALNRDPTATSGVNDSSQTVPQLCVPQQSTAPQPPRLVSRSGQLQEQGFSGGGRENCCTSEVINKNHLQVKVGLI